MNRELESARREYNQCLRDEVLPLTRLTEAEIDQLGFADIVSHIDDTDVRRRFRRMSIRLLDANLREHQSDRPDALHHFNAKSFRELREWQDVSNTWERALWALVSQGDA